MATYFHGNSEIQGGDNGMQTLSLMNPNYVPFSDTTLLLNPTVNALNHSNIPHAPPSSSHHHPLMGIPLRGPTKNSTITSSEDVNNRSSSLHGGTFPGVHYDLWGSITPHQIASLPATTTDVYSQSSSSCRQGLSLSLSPKQVAYNGTSTNNGPAREHVLVAAAGINSQSSVSVVSNGIASMQNVIFESKYLRAAQELLDEVVNVLNVVKAQETKENSKLDKESMAVTAEGIVNIGTDHLTTPQKQELQLKKVKLVTMLEEVEQRYIQYHEHMKVVITSFEQAAGLGSAKSYTALALRTISKQFRCLKDAINEQIKSTSKKLGEEDCLGAKVESSRQRYLVDHDQLRQHFGMIQPTAWRPQRGLPERAVSILRAWLFEHFLHPYPKDSDKQLLAKQTGLTRSQVSNWFINARVRLWKPMVEEMYLEEMKEQDQNGTSEDSAGKTEKSQRASQESKTLGMKQKAFQVEKSNNQNASPIQISSSIISTSPLGRALQIQNGFNLTGSSELLEGVVQTSSPKKPKCTSSSDVQNSPINLLAMDMEMKEATNDRGGGFGAYPMGGIGRFNPNDHQLAPRFHGNGVSLTLGLDPQQSFLSSQHNIQVGRGIGVGSGEADFCRIDQSPQTSHDPTTAYDIEIDQNRKRFAAQLLPDFVT